MIFTSILLVVLPVYAHNQTWSPVGGGVNRHVRALYNDTLSGVLYLGGSFKYADGQVVNGMAKWDGATYSPLGSGSDDCDNYTCPAFLSVTRYKDEIYCSSLGFSVGGGVPSKSLARWNGTSWDSLGGGVTIISGSDGIVWDQLVHQDTLYIMGVFYLGGSVFSPGIVKWDGQEFLPMGFPYAEPLSDQAPWIFSGVFFEDELYVGGQFSTGPTFAQQVDIAKFDGQTWQPVGGGIKGVGDALDLLVYKGELYVGGNFRKSDGNAGDGIMKLKDGNWVDVGGSFDGNVLVSQMLEYHGNMYVFGIFDSVGGGIEARKIAKWDGEKWCGLHNLFDMQIERAAVFHDSLFIGGNFNYIDGDSLPYFAKWYGDYTDTCGIVLGVSAESGKAATIGIYPNPSSCESKIRLPDDIIHAELNLFTTVGQLVLTQRLTSGWNVAQLDGIAPGLYFYEVKDKERVLGSGKLVKIAE